MANRRRPIHSRPNPRQPRPPPDEGSHNDYMVGNIYNSIIHPLMPYGIKGVVWSQGESNEKTASNTGPFSRS